MSSGYTNCACRDCFEIAISSDESKPELCSDCEESGCSADGDSECQRSDAYECDDPHAIAQYAMHEKFPRN
jgi:hypothetical protein